MLRDLATAPAREHADLGDHPARGHHAGALRRKHLERGHVPSVDDAHLDESGHGLAPECLRFGGQMGWWLVPLALGRPPGHQHRLRQWPVAGAAFHNALLTRLRRSPTHPQRVADAPVDLALSQPG